MLDFGVGFFRLGWRQAPGLVEWNLSDLEWLFWGAQFGPSVVAPGSADAVAVVDALHLSGRGAKGILDLSSESTKRRLTDWFCSDHR